MENNTYISGFGSPRTQTVGWNSINEKYLTCLSWS